MKSRIQSVQQLKQVAAAELKTEIDQRLSNALLVGAAQGMAYVMWVLETHYHWKDKRQQQLFESMKQMFDFGEAWQKPLDGASFVQHLIDKYDIDVEQLLFDRCSTTIAKGNPEVRAAGN